MTCFWIARVCSSVEPAGSWTIVMIEPWSSSGRYPVGILR